MNVNIINQLIASFVDTLRSIGVSEIKVGNIAETSERELYGAITAVIKGAATATRFTLTANFEEKAALSIASLTTMKEHVVIDDEVNAALLELIKAVRASVKKQLGEEKFIVSYADPIVTKPDQVNLPELGRDAFLTVPLYTEFGKVLLETTTSQM